MKREKRRPCYECGGEMLFQNLTVDYTIKGKKISVSNVQGYHCPSCGAEIIDDQEFTMIENLLTSLPKNPEIDMLNLSETASILRVSNQTVYNKIKTGEIKAFKVGREWRFLRPDIEAYMQSSYGGDDLLMAARGGKISPHDLAIIKEETENNAD